MVVGAVAELALGLAVVAIPRPCWSSAAPEKLFCPLLVVIVVGALVVALCDVDELATVVVIS